MFFSQTSAIATDLAAEVSEQILVLKSRISNKRKEKLTSELRHHDSQDCLVCKHRELHDLETQYLPYGSFAWIQMSKHVYYYLCHLYIYRYRKDEIMVYLNPLKNTNFFNCENVDLHRWTFKFSDVKDILIVEKC